MSKPSPTITCVYAPTGEPPEEILARSFALFVQREAGRLPRRDTACR